jgi:signal transduction histidine kinase
VALLRIGTLFGLCLAVTGLLIGGLSVARIASDIAEYNERSMAVDVIRTYGETLTVLELLALERGPITASLGGIASPDALDRIRRRARSVDEAIEALRRGIVDRALSDSELLVASVDRIEARDHAARDAAIALIATNASERPGGSVGRITAELLAVPRECWDLLSRLDRLSAHVDPETSQALRVVRTAADLRETAGQLSVSTTAAHVGGRLFTLEETVAVERLRGQFDFLRSRLASRMDVSDLPNSFAAAWQTAQTGFLRQGLAWIEEIVNAGRTDAQYPVSKEAHVERIQPSLQTLLSLRDAALDSATQAAIAARAAALVQVAMEGIVIVALLALMVAIAILLRLRIVRPLLRTAEIIGALVGGSRTIAIPFVNRRDEVGEIARALRVLRDQAAAADRTLEQARRWERSSIDEALRAREEASAASRNKSLFLAGMSHELRTPLNAIVGFAELMQKEMFGPLGDRYRGYATDILNSGIHLLSLVNRILDLSKVEAGAFKPSEAPVSVRDAILHCVTLVELNARAHDIALATHIAEDLPLVRGDATALRQIITNILANAVKFTDAGGSVDIGAEQTTDGAVRISIVDTGLGMSEDDLKLALVPFSRADTPMTRRREGTGLGLPLAKLLTEAIGAAFAITSRPGVGTAVTITFPPSRIVLGSEPRIRA